MVLPHEEDVRCLSPRRLLAEAAEKDRARMRRDAEMRALDRKER